MEPAVAPPHEPLGRIRRVPELIAQDGLEVLLQANGQDWLVSWNGPTSVPDGKPHGSVGICVAHDGAIVLVSSDGARWDLPAGRPEGIETWEQTLRREVMEEACATVKDARLLGYSRGRCIRGHERGLVLVRSFWVAHVDLDPWQPMFEIAHRKVVALVCLFDELTVEPGYVPIYGRALAEARLP